MRSKQNAGRVARCMGESNDMSGRASATAALFCTLVVLATTAYWAMPLQGRGALSPAETRARIEAKLQREASLKNDIAGYDDRIGSIQGRVSRLERRQGALEADLGRKESRQQAINRDLMRTRARLARLRAKLVRAKKILARRLVEVYKSDQPDVLTVVLQSDGFTDLLERADFMRRIARQDRAIVGDVIGLKVETKTQTVRLAKLEREASRLVAQVRARRDEVARNKTLLAGRAATLAGARSNRRASLASVRTSRRDLEDHLASIEREQGNVYNVLNINAGPIKRGTGRFIWPVSGSLTSPFGPRWGRLHAGIDIAAPNGTPLRAADSGTVAFAGWMGGYGNYTCIQHGASLSTCYGHQSRIDVSAGQSVKQGQVVGAVGNTGHSTGDHLHFEVRVGGSPVDPMGYL